MSVDPDSIKLRVRLWVDEVLVADELVALKDSETRGREHAERALQARKSYLVEISDPDENDKVIFRMGSDPSKMERPIAIVAIPDPRVN